MSFTFFKVYKWYRIAQSVSYIFLERSNVFIVNSAHILLINLDIVPVSQLFTLSKFSKTFSKLIYVFIDNSEHVFVFAVKSITEN